MAALLSGEIYFFFLSSSHFSPFRQHLVIDYSVSLLLVLFVLRVCVCVFVGAERSPTGVSL